MPKQKRPSSCHRRQTLLPAYFQTTGRKTIHHQTSSPSNQSTSSKHHQTVIPEYFQPSPNQPRLHKLQESENISSYIQTKLTDYFQTLKYGSSRSKCSN